MALTALRTRQAVSDSSYLNLLTNPGFEVWQRGAGAFATTGTYTADQWAISIGAGSALSVTQDSTHQDLVGGSFYCAALAYTHSATSYLYQRAENYLQFRGRTVTFSIRVRTSTAGAVRLAVYDGVTRQVGEAHSGGGTYETLSLPVKVSASATVLQVELNLSATATVYADNATLVGGTAPLAYQPLHAADEVTRCLRYYETFGGGHAFEHFGVLQCWATTRANGALLFRAPKAVVPTVTFSTAGNFAVQDATATAKTATAVAAAQISVRSCDVDVTVASGLVAGNATLWLANNTTSALITVEANP